MSPPPAPGRVVLVGFMGCGKTTVGALVARQLGWEFVDMDAALERRLGMTVAEAFRARGEEWFRREEEALARELAGRAPAVIAAGGGAFTVPATRAALQEGAVTVWLRCGLETALARIPRDGSRPLAADHATIGRLFDQRAPLYQLADRHVDASQGPPEDVARAVVAALR
ncbi:MAG TPA: shikimate kinase [Vicinamibacteria bacterium]|nr:shikimate kinase [Vicinamibacteria bacterium]